jgi:hypothetical protein
MAHWFTYTGGCTSVQATKLDDLAKALGLGDNAGLELFAQSEACSIAKAGYCMSIERADRSIDRAGERLIAAEHRRRWRAC